MGDGEMLDYIVIRRRQVRGWSLYSKTTIRRVNWGARCFETFLVQGYSSEVAAWLVSGGLNLVGLPGTECLAARGLSLEFGI